MLMDGNQNLGGSLYSANRCLITMLYTCMYIYNVCTVTYGIHKFYFNKKIGIYCYYNFFHLFLKKKLVWEGLEKVVKETQLLESEPQKLNLGSNGLSSSGQTNAQGEKPGQTQIHPQAVEVTVLLPRGQNGSLCGSAPQALMVKKYRVSGCGEYSGICWDQEQILL